VATYRVEVDPAAQRDLAKLPGRLQARILARVGALAPEPRPPTARKLTDSADTYRLRVGDYRVLYRIRDNVLLVLVVAVAHRKHVYKQG
jgi:mRNA interferase RelE/StbE